MNGPKYILNTQCLDILPTYSSFVNVLSFSYLYQNLQLLLCNVKRHTNYLSFFAMSGLYLMTNCVSDPFTCPK